MPLADKGLKWAGGHGMSALSLDQGVDAPMLQAAFAQENQTGRTYKENKQEIKSQGS